MIGTFFYFFVTDKSSGMAIGSAKERNSDISEKQISRNDNIQETNFKYQIYGVKDYNVYMKISPEGVEKLFYYHQVNEPLSIPLLEGNIEEYQIHSIGGQKYYPLIIGYEEAKIMRQEGLFYNIGDPLKNFFGKNVVVVGVMQRTGGALDMAHLIPLNSEELN